MSARNPTADRPVDSNRPLEVSHELVDKAEPTPFVFTRVVSAPRALVWQAWTSAEHLMKWFGPKGFKMKVAKLDLRPGGSFHYALEAPNGALMWGLWSLREVEAPHRLVIVTSFSDEHRGKTRHPMAPDWPLESLSTLTLTEEGGKTTITIDSRPLNPSPREREVFEGGRSSMQQGWTGTIEQLEAHLRDLS